MPKGQHRGNQRPIVVEPDEDGCWIIVSHVPNKRGYASIMRDRKVTRIHRYVFELFHGYLLPGEVVRHSCDKPLCVNPFCLRRGTIQDNSDDMVLRGRSSRGTTHPKAKLTDEQVRSIKETDSSVSNPELAERFGVTNAAIWWIRTGQTWKHIR